MDVSYHAGTWYAAHDPLGADNSADHLPDTFKAYLFVVAPRLREIQRTLNVEIKGVVTAGALAELEALVEDAFAPPTESQDSSNPVESASSDALPRLMFA